MYNKKAISAVVSTALILVVTVASIVAFGTWFGIFQSGTLVDVEQNNAFDSKIKIEAIINDQLYIKSDISQNLTYLKVSDSSGSTMCEFSGNSTVDSTGLVGWWTFDEILNNGSQNYTPDLSGLNNHAFINSSTNQPSLIPSNLNYALDFDGVDDYLYVLDDNSLDGFSSFTIFALVKPDEYVDNFIISKYNHTSISNTDDAYALRVYSGNKIRINVNNLSGYDFRGYPFSSFGSVKSIIYSYNGSNINVYSEDVLTNISYNNGNINMTGLVNNIPNDLFIGAGQKPGLLHKFFKGQIDEIRIYNRTLSEEEVSKLYWYSVKSQLSGSNQIDLSSCNLVKNQAYKLASFTDSSNSQVEIIAK